MLRRIPLDLITRNPDQPRQNFDEAALWDLADSIRQNGLKQPITVRPHDDGQGHTHQVIMGERRFRAHKLLQAEGDAEDILCHVRKMDDATMHIDAILENLQRVDVSPLEEARAYQRAIDQHGFTAETLAKRLGIKQSFRIGERLQLLNLTPRMQELMATRIITPTQAYCMAILCPEGQERFLKLVKQGIVTTYKASMEAAQAIKAQMDQIGMDLPDVAPKRASAKPVTDRIDELGRALAPLLKDGQPNIPAGISLDDAQVCANKLALLRKTIVRIEDALGRSAALAAVA